MNNHMKKVEIMRKYYQDIRTSFDFFIEGDIPEKRINNAVKKFAPGLDMVSILGFYDTTIMGSGKSGYIFTDTKVYYIEILGKPEKLWYDEIERIELMDEQNPKDDTRKLRFCLKDGKNVIWSDTFLNKTPLLHFFNEIMEISYQSPSRMNYYHKNTNPFKVGSMTAGLGIGAYGTVNKSYNEEKFHARQGHGFAAERANDMFDKLTGRNAKILGDTNVRNGADRIVDGVEIQSKYCGSGFKCINECFTEGGKGTFRYYMKNGKPMQIEVPSDKYDAAISAMEEKIRHGQIKGITNPSEAKSIVRKGHFTYEQAKNIAKAGTVESLTYDAANGAIIASSAFGVSAVISFASSVWNGDEIEIALKKAAYSGIAVGGTTFITNILVSQLSRAGLNSALVGSSEAIVSLMGPKASAVLINAFRNGGNIYGAAAMKSAAKLLRGNVITAGVTMIVLSSRDVADIFRGRISGKQLFKNVTNTASAVAGGTAGWVGGAAIGATLLPGVGAIVGGIVGSFGAGTMANKASDTILGTFIEDDAEEMVKILEKCFEQLAVDYLLSQVEAEKIIDNLKECLNGKMLKEMFASADREGYAKELLLPLVEKEIAKRRYIALPSKKQMLNGVKEILEDIADVS